MKTGLTLAALLALALSPIASFAQPFAANDYGSEPLERGNSFSFEGGKAIFTGVCQGCHMPDAKGAVGAGMYPALASDKKLEVAGYPLSVVTHGQKAMPPFGDMLNDRQIADVVNYVRTSFGNKYKDKVKPEDVKAQR
ncbi:MAG TPA: cytochrome c [Rhizomicrobium sp.]|jgi:mono/diheme cytochrome c family protein|nr:cytochrome c [Rhizomicrobium sp.]